MSFLSKDKFNLKRNSKKIYATFLSVIIFGFLFFVLTGFILEEEPDILASPINEKMEINQSNNLKILEWIYDKDKKEMNIVVDLDGLEREYGEIITEAYQRSDGGQVNSEVIYQYKDNAVIKIYDFDEDYQQIALDIIGDNSDIKGSHYNEDSEENETLITIYTDYRDVENKQINEYKDGEWLSYLNKIMIEESEKQIKKSEGVITKNEDKSSEIDQEIVDIKDGKAYQTESERIDSDSDINALEVEKDQLEKDNSSLKNDIEKAKEKIEKLETEERDTKAKSL